jgi:hypothetical protein
MDVRFDRPDRLVQDLRNLGMTAAFDKPERRRGAQMHRQLQQRLLHEFDIRTALHDLLGLLGTFLRFVQKRVGVGERIERDVRRPLGAESVPRYV